MSVSSPVGGNNPCGHRTLTPGCGGCDPGAVEFIRDDGGPWVRVSHPMGGNTLREKLDRLREWAELDEWVEPDHFENEIGGY